MSARFDELIHAPARLTITALLAPADWVEFRFLRERTELSESALSKHLTALVNAGYVEVRKGALSGRRVTWFRLTAHGRTAFEGHVKALEQMLTPGAPPPAGQPAPATPA